MPWPPVGFADALGGSALLGLSVATSVAAILGWLAWSMLRWFAAHHRDLLRAIEAIFVALLPANAPSVRIEPSFALVRRPAAVFARAAKRGPPIVLSL